VDITRLGGRSGRGSGAGAGSGVGLGSDGGTEIKFTFE
jgi:hypothetical protein